MVARKAGDQREISKVERDTVAAKLREDGHSWIEIARKLGYASPGHACQAVKKLLDRIPVEAIADLRATENARLEAMRLSAIGILRNRHIAYSNGRLVYEIKGGVEVPVTDDGPALKALEVLIKVDEAVRRLNGLDAPQQLSLSGSVNVTLVGVDVEGL